LASTTTHVRRTVRQLLPLACHHLHTVTVYIHCFPNKEITSYQPRGRRDDMLPADLRPSADGSAVRTSLVAAAGSQRADSIGSCATQPACYSLGWDRQMDGSRYRLMPPPYDRGIIKYQILSETAATTTYSHKSSQLYSRTVSLGVYFPTFSVLLPVMCLFC